MVRAKFRCLNIHLHLQGTTVELKPVIPKSDDWPGGAEENRKFWEASPTGEMELKYRKGVDAPFEVGGYYYIDLERLDAEEERSWKLWEVARQAASLGIKLGLSWHHEPELVAGDLTLGIENEGAWDAFDGHVDSSWRVTVTEALPPEPGQATYPN